MNEIPDEVVHYIVSMQDIIKNDEESKKDLFGHDFIDESVWWKLFEAKAIVNYATRSNPAVTPDQFKEIHAETMKACIEDTMQDLVKQGLAIETDEGFKLAPGVKVAKNTADNNEKQS